VQLKALELQREAEEERKAQENIKKAKEDMVSKLKSRLGLQTIKNVLQKQNVQVRGEVAENKSEDKGLPSERKEEAKSKKMKLTNELVLKLFIDNFKELATLAQVKSACIKCQKIKRASP
jgi:hypothetical protein